MRELSGQETLQLFKSEMCHIQFLTKYGNRSIELVPESYNDTIK